MLNKSLSLKGRSPPPTNTHPGKIHVQLQLSLCLALHCGIKDNLYFLLQIFLNVLNSIGQESKLAFIECLQYEKEHIHFSHYHNNLITIIPLYRYAI